MIIRLFRATAGLFLLALAFCHLSAPDVSAQGSLTPPGAPAPTMKTLAQVEPRTPIGSLPFAIINSGSYYLTGSLTGQSGQDGITISTNNVTLDLEGFALLGVSGSQTGIAGAGTNISIINGAVQNWLTGIGMAANAVQVSRLRVSYCLSAGFNVGPGSMLSDCFSQENGGDGFEGLDHSMFTTWSALGNTGSGFNVYPSCVFISCIAGGNAYFGFYPDNDCTFKDCAASGNTNAGIFALHYANCVIQNCTALGNGVPVGGDGISAGPGGVVRGCSAASSGGNGITAVSACVIDHCAATGNTGSGIDSGGGSVQECSTANNSVGITTGNGCVIDHCTATANNVGISGSGCVIDHCISTANNGDGIDANGCMIEDCIISGNTGIGILFREFGSASGCLVATNSLYGISLLSGSGFQVIGNTCVSNQEVGILIECNNGRIDGNHVATRNGTVGIEVAGAEYTNNVIVRNTVSGSGGSDYSIPSGDVGPIGAAATATSPWANIQH